MEYFKKECEQGYNIDYQIKAGDILSFASENKELKVLFIYFKKYF